MRPKLKLEIYHADRVKKEPNTKDADSTLMTLCHWIKRDCCIQ